MSDIIIPEPDAFHDVLGRHYISTEEGVLTEKAWLNPCERYFKWKYGSFDCASVYERGEAVNQARGFMSAI